MSGDSNLLFGMLALRLDFVSRDALIESMRQWVRDKSQSLGAILERRGLLGAERRGLLDSLVREHLAQHDSDPVKSLQALSTVPSVREELLAIGDDVLTASVPGMSFNGAATGGVATKYEPEAVSVSATADSSRRFRILRPHAEGGLGKVSLALDAELNREVALKEIKEKHADVPESRSRFMLEAEITGGLEHPGIVPVYALGRYADGRPYYAMRFIRGENLQQAIKALHASPPPRSLALRQLLRRFMDVCNAMAYAHSRGVVHRDLKPSNIMLGAYGETLIVDWGLAKTVRREDIPDATPEPSLHPAAKEDITPTRRGQVVGTPQFMSPEQASGRLDELGPASDIYSLGATLYCLLTGQPPFPDPRLVGQDEVLRQVRGGEFPPPSRGHTDVPRALEAVCLKAMRLNPEDRYATARALADDVERWLADEAVSAWQEPRLARLSRWGRRHRAIVSSAAVLALTVTVACGVGMILLDHKQRETERLRQVALQKEAEALHLMDEADEQREEAERQTGRAQTSQQIAEAQARLKDEALRFLAGTFETADPLGLSELSFYIPRRTGEKLDAEAILRRGADKAMQDNESHPEVRAAILNSIGDAYRAIGKYKEAEAALRTSHDLRLKTLPPDHLDMAASVFSLGWLLHDKGDYDRALEYYRQALAIRSAKLDDNDPLLVNSHFNLAWLLTQMGEFGEAEKLFQSVIASRKLRYGPVSRPVAVALVALAAMYLEKGEFIRAYAPSAESMEIMLQLEGQTGLGQAVGMYQGAMIELYKNQDRALAQRKLEECLRMTRQVFGPTHVYVGLVLFEVARLREALDDLEGAESGFRECLRIARATVGLGHPKVAILIEHFAELLQKIGKGEEGERLCIELVQAHEERFGPKNRLLADALVAHADFRRACNDRAGQEKLLRDAIGIYEQKPERFSWRYFLALRDLAGCYLAQGKSLDEAARLLRRALQLTPQLTAQRTEFEASLRMQLARTLLTQSLDSPDAREQLEAVRATGRQNSSTAALVPFVADALTELGALHRRANQIPDAAAAARELGELWPTNPDLPYRAACEFAACMAAASKEPNADGKAAREEYRAQALECLTTALRNGFRNYERLHTDKRLDPLRAAPEFRALEERLKAGS